MEKDLIVKGGKRERERGEEGRAAELRSFRVEERKGGGNCHLSPRIARCTAERGGSPYLRGKADPTKDPGEKRVVWFGLEYESR